MKAKKKVVKRLLVNTKHRAAKRRIKAKRGLHQRFVLHPLTVFALLLIGVYITGLTYRVLASNNQITAEPLLEGALITSPADGTSFTAKPVDISGTCPSDSYISLYDNSVFAGSAWCTNNVFNIQADLVSGAHTLVAQDFNVADNPGPSVAAVNVTYAPPAPTAPPSQSGAPVSKLASPSSTTSDQPLRVSSDYHFQAFDSDSDFSWQITLVGGTAPYDVHLEWGDSQSGTMMAKNRVFNITHVYKTTGYYPVKIKVTDAKGQVGFLQIAALIKVPGALGFLDSYNNPANQPAVAHLSLGAKIKKWLWIIWPVYVTTILMAVSFWLGERQELDRFLRAANASRHRLHHP
jgi:hypothetical protein